MIQWQPEAEAAIKKVPFFVRKRVKARVEEEALRNGKTVVTLAEVNATQKRYLSGMASEIRGYQLDACFGPSGCPNQIRPSDDLLRKIEEVLKNADLLTFLKSQGIAELKFHHEFRITLADCPNACSQPQIKDLGIIAACRPAVSDAPCSACQACSEACREDAIRLDANGAPPIVDGMRCVACGQCLAVCPTGTLLEGAKGYRVQLGGKLGRHPRLALEMPGFFDADTVLDIVQAAIDLYKARSRKGQRFGEILRPSDIEEFSAKFRSRTITPWSI